MNIGDHLFYVGLEIREILDWGNPITVKGTTAYLAKETINADLIEYRVIGNSTTTIEGIVPHYINASVDWYVEIVDHHLDIEDGKIMDKDKWWDDDEILSIDVHKDSDRFFATLDEAYSHLEEKTGLKFERGR